MPRTAIVSGTAKSIPTGPRTQPQKRTEIITTAGETPKPLPMNRGSRMLPRIWFTTRYQTASATAAPVPETLSASATPGTAAITEPIAGTKLSRKAASASSSEAEGSIPATRTPAQMQSAVAAETSVLMPM